jgi:hypothetical protein
MHFVHNSFVLITAFFCSLNTLSAQHQLPAKTFREQVQEENDPVEAFFREGGLRYTFGEEGNAYIKFGVGSQFWVRHIWNNPGSTNVQGDTVARTFDVAMRRMRFSLTAHFARRFTLYTQFGVNNQTFTSGGAYSPTGPDNKKPGMFIHDFWVKFPLLPEKLNFGIGLNAFNGVSRLTNVSYMFNFMLDNPTFNFPNIEHTDQIGRQLGFFAHGNLARLNYRFAYAKPFVYADRQRDDPPVGRAVEVENERMAAKGYAYWQFWDTEENLLPFTRMTYLGKKRILNVGAGFDYHPASTISLDTDGEEHFHNRLALGADVFLELPTERGSAFNMYLVGYHYDYGPNFLRASGSMNISSGGFLEGEPLPQGGGNQQFILGTGNIVYASFGYLLHKPLLKSRGRLQPFYAYTYKNFEGLGTPSMQHDLGLNYLLYGQHVKFSLQYSSRPIYRGSIGADARGDVVDSRGMLIFQAQITL